jgi:hypothetical protein
MVNARLIASASALLLLVPVYVWAEPDPTNPLSILQGPDPNDPSTLLVEGGAKQLVNVSDVALYNPPQFYEVEPNSTMGHEQLVEGHTTFAVITLQAKPVNETGSILITAAANCTAQTGVDTWEFLGEQVPCGVHTTTLQCLENAQIVALPDPLPGGDSRISPLRPDGVVLPFTTPLGEAGYETEYAYNETNRGPDGAWRTEARYAWGVAPMRPWIDATSGISKNVLVALPLDRLTEMGQRSFHVVDARTLSFSG